MKVSELIGVLENLDPEREVFADGCDCTNPVTGVINESWLDLFNGKTGKYEDKMVAVIKVEV